MSKIILYVLIGFLLIISITAISLNPLLINQDKVKTFMAEKLFYTNPELTSANFTINKITIDGNLAIIKITQDKKAKTLIVSNRTISEKLT